MGCVTDLIVLFGAALVGGIVIVIGSVLALSRKVSEPKKELQQRVAYLEEELDQLKSGNK